jgi:hypothetical protein
MQFIALTILGFSGLEIFSYAVHRWLFHGVLWRVHQTHHTPRKSWFELNDLFSAGFAGVSVLLIVFSETPLFLSVSASRFTVPFISLRMTFSRIVDFYPSVQTINCF